MASKEYARDIIEILQSIFQQKNSTEYEAYKNGTLSMEQLVKFVSEYYYQAKIEELSQEITGEEQIQYVLGMLQQKNKGKV